MARATGREAAIAADVLSALAEVLETLQDPYHRAREQITEVRFEAKRLRRSESLSFGLAKWIEEGLAAAIDALERSSPSGDSASYWIGAARRSQKSIDTKLRLTFQRAKVQDAVRTTIDALIVIGQGLCDIHCAGVRAPRPTWPVGTSPPINLTVPFKVDNSLTSVRCVQAVASANRAAQRMQSLQAVDEQRMMTAPVFLDIMGRWQPHLAPLDERPTALRTRAERPPSQERLWAALDLLGGLEEAVGVARDHLMQQVLNALHSEVLRPTLRFKTRQLAVVMATLSELNHEATRSSPDAAQFCQRARLLIDIMLLA